MSIKRVIEEKIGDCEVIIADIDGTYRGIVRQKGKEVFSLEGKDLDQLRAALRNHAGKLHPDYFGMDGAKARFLKFFPEGFDDPYYKFRERDYKDRARAALINAAPLDAALSADASTASACKKATTNLLSQFEAARLNELLGSPDGVDFVKASAEFTKSPNQASLDAIVRTIKPHGRPSWPLATYLPFMWMPSEHMFLKPNATVDFAVRTGKSFAEVYDSALEIRVYQELLSMAAETERDISDLHPSDRIDLQSFIWVVGSYTDRDVDG